MGHSEDTFVCNVPRHIVCLCIMGNSSGLGLVLWAVAHHQLHIRYKWYAMFILKQRSCIHMHVIMYSYAHGCVSMCNSYVFFWCFEEHFLLYKYSIWV